MKIKISQFIKALAPRGLKLSSCLTALLGSMILAFGLYNVHSLSGVTEGGVPGLTLLLEHWFDISPAVSGLILNTVCYLIGLQVLGSDFIWYSLISGGGFSLFYAIFEQFPRVYPGIADHPLAASITGAVFVGVGVGLSVRVGGASGGDDALAMALEHVTKIPIQWLYLISDLTVLGLSLTYIPLNRILYSILTVVLSGQIIGWIQKCRIKNWRYIWHTFRN